MRRSLPVLDVDLLIDHGGHQLKLKGSEMCFAAKFPTLRSLFHFFRIFWSSRTRIPREASFHVEWRRLRIPVKVREVEHRSPGSIGRLAELVV
jgi:hypothetical protein